ncbi:MAG: DUF3458 domain-containing protein, partial [Pseudomonadota bacterium]|nr:DUF3458 domain-containing protein [Pseudomonadota bacterium]
FSRHDGQAVTTDDFVAAMEQASGRNLKQFKLWYSQAGTPEIHVRAEHDPDQKTYTLFFRQHTPPTPGQPSKQALLIPFALALLDKKGQELPLTIQGEPTETGPASPKSKLVEITKEQQSITFLNIKEEPVPSLLRNFSAPVKLSFDFTDNMLAFLSQHDTDPFNRWEAGQNLALKFLAILVKEHQQDLPFTSPEKILTLFRSILADPDLDDAFKALSLTLPNEQYLAEQFNRIDVEAIHAAHLFLTQFLAQSLQDQWIRTYQARKNDQPNRDGQSIGRRSLKNLSLHYLSHLEEATCTAVIQEQFYGSQCMTDEISALICLERKGGDLREQGLEHFYNRWSNQPLIIDKWFTIQATSNHPEAFNQVQKLVAHPDFTLSNPNRVRSLLGAFSHSNLSGFHQKEGQVYNFFACIICDLDSRNPQLASRLAQAFSKWHKFDEQRGDHMKAALENILKKTDLSKDTYEIVEKSLS